MDRDAKMKFANASGRLLQGQVERYSILLATILAVTASENVLLNRLSQIKSEGLPAFLKGLKADAHSMSPKEIEISYKVMHHLLQKLMKARSFSKPDFSVLAEKDFSSVESEEFSDAILFIVGVAKGLFAKELPDVYALVSLPTHWKHVRQN